MTDNKSEKIFDILPNTLAKLKPDKLSDKLTNAKPTKRDEMRY